MLTKMQHLKPKKQFYLKRKKKQGLCLGRYRAENGRWLL